MHVSIAWLKDRPEAYRALFKLWVNEEFIAKPMKARECRGTGGPPAHMYGCHTPFRERGNEASIRVSRMFKSHAWQQYDKQMQCY
jgi:hypothetical protein